LVYEDIYFLSYEEAYYCAKQQNKMDNGYRLQICYYDGEYKDSEFINLVHLPIDNLSEILAFGTYRFPTKISFTGTNFSDEIKELITNNFNESLRATQVLRNKCNNYYFNMALTQKPDFKEPLRFFLQANVNTQVMQYVTKNIADTLKEKGFDVLLRYIYGIEDLHSLKEYVEFNPHVTININHLNNDYINSEVFNFIWFQDPMPILLDNTIPKIRKNDYIYSLVNVIDSLLEKKNIPFSKQGFCINKNIFYEDSEIEREKKVIFIGSSYLGNIPQNDNTKELIESILVLYNKGSFFSDKIIKNLSKKFDTDLDLIKTRVIPYVIRDFSVLTLCELDIPYTVEIYGAGWDVYPQIKPFYHGVLEYGKTLNEVYNTATFVFAPHQNYILQQRTLEGAACGAIPILYDCRAYSDEKTYEEAICYFKTKDELEKILTDKNSLKKDLLNLVNENDYSNIVDRIINTIKEKKGAR